MVSRDNTHAVVLDLESAATIDLDGADVLTLIDRELERQEIEVVLAGVGHQHIELLRKAGTREATAKTTSIPPSEPPVAALRRDTGR
jgi:MFS superfamily sulfate permease-like transporter